MLDSFNSVLGHPARNLTAIFLSVAMGLTVHAAPKDKGSATAPDLTQGGKPDAYHDWTLGPTGARGWIHAWKLDTSESRQIYITKVESGSPADGVLKVGDVILGLDGKPFMGDARVSFGKAITRAESTAHNGKLQLLRWRSGNTEPITIQIKILGDYSQTAPYGCDKSKQIIAQGCEAIASKWKSSPKRGNPIERSLNALALLASGDRKYHPLLADEARWAANYQITEIRGFQSWWYGYANLFLAEYILATGDKSVFPGMQRMTLEIAKGQSAVGTWGHTFADKKTGILMGYGAMNSPALPLTMSLVLAREAGVSDPAVDKAILLSQRLLSFYIGKGAIPYGDHNPWMETHEDNGKCGAAAVMFDLLADKQGATFFSWMSTASHGPERDGGHTGNFFNLLWALPGVARAGPHATGAWIHEFGWYLDLARRWDGSYIYQGEPGTKYGKDHQYPDWDSTGAYILGYAAAEKSLRITGKRPSHAPALDATAASKLIADGRGWNHRNKAAAFANKDTAALMAGLKSWSPIVRKRCAGPLASRKDVKPADFIAMLESGDSYAQLGACEALGAMGPRAAEAVLSLRRALSADDRWLRIQAAEALAGIGDAAKPTVPDLLRLTTETDPSDPRGMVQRYLAFVLFQKKSPGNKAGLISGSLADLDRKDLFDAVRAVLQNQDGRARGAVASIFDRLTFEEIQPLLPAIHQAIIKQAPSGVMFSDNIRLSGLAFLAKHHIREGIPLCVSLIEPDRWGQGRRYAPCLKALESYGSAAKSQLEELRKIESILAADAKSKTSAANLARLRQTIHKIENATAAPELRNLAD